MLLIFDSLRHTSTIELGGWWKLEVVDGSFEEDDIVVGFSEQVMVASVAE